MCEQSQIYRYELIRTDVTAVKIFNDYILAGIGSKIYIYKQDNPGIHIERVQALNGQKIYGFVLTECGSKILVYGGKQFTVVLVNGNTNDDGGYKFVKLFESIVIDDWVHSGLWVDQMIVLLTAHNVVQRWDLQTQTQVDQYESKDNSILYSGLLLPLVGDILVMAGTVFSEVIIHCISDNMPLHHLKGHKGVIFSISCHPQKQIIVTTSDDRSIRVWSPNELPHDSIDTKEYWKNVNIACKNILYGHTARVMRSCISDHSIISVGEDSAICHWDFQGNLLKKATVHQNGEIWAVDSNNKYVVTGGADSGLICHPIITSSNCYDSETFNFKIGMPKRLKFTKRKNLVVLNETDLIYYDMTNDEYTKYGLNHESTYKMLDITDSKEIIAISDMNGKLDLYEESTESIPQLLNVLDTKLDIGRILSMHFITLNFIVFCSENGAINVINTSNKVVKVYDTFILPPCKERWVTAAAKNTSDLFVIGDRCGNIHVYKKGQENPIKSFSKVHGRYGPTSITINYEEIITTGRNGTIKYFSFKKDNLHADEFQYMHSKNLEFEWVEQFLGSRDELVCGFRERLFVICDIQSNLSIAEISCGGGHRSWDVICYSDKSGECIQFVYIKISEIITATVHKTRIRSVDFIDGWHSKEINCLKTFKYDELDLVFYLSGSEDTTLRLTESSKDYDFKQRAVFKYLSSVKSLKVYKLDSKRFFIVSAGGRAQIIIKTVNIARYPKITFREDVNYMIKGTDRERRGDKGWRECTTDFDPETRVMDIELVKDENEYLLIAGCSDAIIRVFTFQFDGINSKFKLLKEIKYHKTCILITRHLNLFNEDILVVCTTSGEVAFWDVSRLKANDVKPFLTINTNKSGINSFSFTSVNDVSFLIATGGDDNSIHLNLLKIENDLASIKVVHKWSSSQYHSSQITGLCFVDKYLVSASIDQRVTLFKWDVVDEAIRIVFQSQHWTDIADVHGLDLVEFSRDAIAICVFGKGMEVISLPIK